MRIMVTNDDGIDSLGLHALARAVADLGDVTVIAPATEYSGAGASLGTLNGESPIARQHNIEGLDGVPCWSITGPPALCTMYAQLGTFDGPFDLIVSGINPGQNVGWSVYHSGTIGAALTGRNRSASGIAVSLGFNGADFEGQTWGDIVDSMRWDTGAAVAREAVIAMIEAPSDKPVVVNCNIPNLALEEIEGWSFGTVGTEPPRRMITGALVEDGADPDGAIFRLKMDWGSKGELTEGTDGWLVANRRVSMSWLGDLSHTDAPAGQSAAVTARLDALLP